MINKYYNDFNINLSRIKRRIKINKQIFNTEKENNTIYTMVNKKISLKHYSKINNHRKRQLEHIQIAKTESNNNKNYISLSELYTMPNYKTKTVNFFTEPRKELLVLKERKNKIRKNLYKKNHDFKFITINTNNNKELQLMKNEEIKKRMKNNVINKKMKTIDQFANLSNFMRERFYSDIEDKYNHQFRNKAFFYDISVKHKIIQLNQIKEFWGGMSDYTNPILCTKRVRYLSKLIEDRRNLRKKKNESTKKNNNINISIPKLYTNSVFIEKRREEIKKLRSFINEKKNKTQDNMVFFI